MNKVLFLSALLIAAGSHAASGPYGFNKDHLPDGSRCIDADQMRVFTENQSFGWYNYVCYRYGEECGRKTLKTNGTRISGPVGDIVCKKSSRELALTNGMAFWFESRTKGCTVEVTTPGGYVVTDVLDYCPADLLEERYRQIKIMACKNSLNGRKEPKALFKFLDKCVEYSVVETTPIIERVPCGKTHQNDDGTSNRPYGCGYGASWSKDSKYAGY